MDAAPPLPDGVGYAAVRVLDDYAIGYLRTDGVVVARLVDGTEVSAPPPPDGAVYTSIGFAGKTLGMLRSDGAAVFMAVGKGTFAGKTPGQSATVAPPAGRRWAKLAGAWDYALLLDSAGRARSVAISAKDQGNKTRRMFKVPKLPSGVRYTDISAADESAYYLRSDGAVRLVRWFPSTEVALWRPGAGRRVERLGADLASGMAYMSDREAVPVSFKGRLDCETEDGMAEWGVCPKTLPAVPLGWYVAAVTGLGAGNTITGLARLPKGKAVSSIGEVAKASRGAGGKTASSVVIGRKAQLVVNVISRRAVKGGKVVVKRGDGKVLGRAKIAGGARAKVPINTALLSPGKNKLTVSYRGNARSKASAWVPLTLEAARW
jgi:hypothetical protein